MKWRPKAPTTAPPRISWERRPLLRAHLSLLVLGAIAITWTYPLAAGPVLLLVLAAGVSELAPQTWRRFFLAEILLLACGAVGFLWTRELDVGGPPSLHLQSFAGWIRLIVLYWLLVPCRVGMLRWLPLLAACEILMALRSGAYRPLPADVLLQIPFTSLLTQVAPGLLPALRQPAWAAGLLTVGAIAALAIDAHLRIAGARREDVLRGRSPAAPVWRWALLPALIVLAAALIEDLALRRLGVFAAAGPSLLAGGGAHAGARLDSRLRLGDHRWVDTSPQAVAFLDDGDGAAIRYLRVLALPEIEVDGAEIDWVNRQAGTRRLDGAPLLHRGHGPRLTTLFVSPAASAGDAVPAPDGRAVVGLDEVEQDPFGNLFIAGFSELPRRYTVDLGADGYPAGDEVIPQLDLLTRLPEALAGPLRAGVPQIEQWKAMTAEDAARGIIDVLAARCTYATDDLPTADPARPGSSLLQFILAPDDALRRGHCQYFASALVCLLRASGHGARCVSGYASAERGDGRTVFRAFNAHAWAEVLVRRGRDRAWVRVEATPPAFLARLGDAEAGAEAQRAALEALRRLEDAERRVTEARGSPGWYLFAGLALLVVVGAVFVVARRRHRRDPRQAALERATEDLVRAALALGVGVDRHTTLSTIVTGLERRSGLDLSAWHLPHLAARYADGPLPPPWPLAEIRAAVARREQERQAARAK